MKWYTRLQVQIMYILNENFVVSMQRACAYGEVGQSSNKL